VTRVFDRRQLRRSFGRAAPNYAAVAALQREAEARLLEQLDYLDDRQPARILDLGCGPGRAAGAMKKRWPKAEVIALDCRPADAARGTEAHTLRGGRCGG